MPRDIDRQQFDHYELVDYENLDHYGGRRRLPWVKLHVSELENELVMSLSPVTRYVLHAFMLLAARYQNRIPASPSKLAGILTIPRKTCADAAAELESLAIIRRVTLTQDELRMALNGQMRLDPASNVASTAASTEVEVEEEPPLPPQPRKNSRAARTNPRAQRRNQRAVDASVGSDARAVRRRSFVESVGYRLPSDELRFQLAAMGAGDDELETLVELAGGLLAANGDGPADDPEPEL